MRNLKRALSLTLASVMLLGMMVVGSSAAGFPDVDENDNIEAIEVLQAVKVMVGDDNGNFGPDDQVNRAQMAVVMALLLDLDYDYYKGTNIFWDVPSWAEPYVAACYANGIVSGYGNGQYGAGDPVTAVQAASMMMRALGYFKYQSDYADGFELSTVKQASKIQLFAGVNAATNTTALTRNQVAQLALNTLKTPIVEPDDNTLNITTSAGNATTTVTGGRVNYTVVASTQAFARAIDATESQAGDLAGRGGCTVELGEQLYQGDLKLYKYTEDDFRRPTRTWEYDGKTIGSYVKKELLDKEYTAKVTGKDLYEQLTKDVVDHYDFTIAIDGETTSDVLTGYGYFTKKSIDRGNTDAVGKTGKGVLTQVFVDPNEGANGHVYISIINTYLAKATENYDAKNDDVQLKVFKIDDPTTDHYVKRAPTTVANVTTFYDDTFKVEGEDFAIEDVKEDDLFLVTVADNAIQTMKAPEVIEEATLNAFKKGSWVNADGTQYDYASTAQYDEEVLDRYDNVNMKDVTYNIILDQYGYLIGLELNEEPNQYVFVTGTDKGSSNLTSKNAEVNVIFLDGTMDTITVDVKKSKVNWNGSDANGANATKNLSQVNTWCTYTVNADGVYTLKEVGVNSTLKTAKKVAQSAMDADTYDDTDKDPIGPFDINNKNVSMQGSKVRDTVNGDYNRVYGNDDTVYINVKLENVDVKDTKNGTKQRIIDDIDSVTTGVKNVDFTVKNLTAKNGYAAPKDEAYALYNKDGYIIAAITLEAEDKGTNVSYAYIIDEVEQEEYLGNSEWRWTQEAIIDGKVVKLTEVDDTLEILDTTEIGKWYEVRFNGKGNVSSLKPNDKLSSTGDTARGSLAAGEVTGDEIYFKFTKDRFINDMDEVWSAINGKNSYESSKTVLLFVDFCTNNTGTHVSSSSARADLSFKNGTLYTNTDQTQGFSVSPNVKVVLGLAAKGHGDPFDKVDDTYEGYNGLNSALNSLDSSADAFDGYLCAVIEDGDATSIILDERSGATNKNWEAVKPMTVNATFMGSDNVLLGTESFSWYGTTDVTTSDFTWTIPSGYAEPSPANKYLKSKFVEDETVNITFTYLKQATTQMNVMVKFIDDTTKGVLAQKIEKVADKVVAPATSGDGILTINAGTAAASDDLNVKDMIPAGYKIKGTAVYTDFFEAGKNVTVEFTVEADTVKQISVETDPTNGYWVKYGGTYDKTAAAGMEIKVEYDAGTEKVIAITDAKLVLSDNTTMSADGDIKITYDSGKFCQKNVKVYADVNAAVTSGTNLSAWKITAPADSTTKTGKVTLTFEQVAGQEADFDATAMATLVGKLGGTGTTGATVGTIDNAKLVQAGVTAAAGTDAKAAKFTVDVALDTLTANTVAITLVSA